MDRIIRFFDWVGGLFLAPFTLFMPLLPSIMFIGGFLLAPARKGNFEEFLFQMFLFGLVVAGHMLFYVAYAMFRSLRWHIKNGIPLLPRICGIQFYLLACYFSFALPLAGFAATGINEWSLSIGFPAGWGYVLGIPTGIIFYAWFVRIITPKIIPSVDAEMGVIITDTLDARDTTHNERNELVDAENGIPSQYRVARSGRSFMMLHERIDKSEKRDPNVPLDLQTTKLTVEFETGTGPKALVDAVVHYYYDLRQPARLIRAKRSDAIKEGLEGLIKSRLSGVMADFNPTTGFNKETLDGTPGEPGINQNVSAAVGGDALISDTNIERLYGIIIGEVGVKISREKTHQDRLEIDEEFRRLNGVKGLTPKEALRAAQVNQRRITVAVNENISEAKITGKGAEGLLQMLDHLIKQFVPRTPATGASPKKKGES